MKKRMVSRNFLFGIIAIAAIAFSCNSPEEAKPEEVIIEEDVVVEEVVIEEDVWIIDEHQINDIPVTTKASTSNSKDEIESQTETAQPDEVAEIDYQIHTPETVDQSMTNVGYEPQVVSITEAIIPLEETQTVIAYNKKGEEISTVQVISSPDGSEIEQIIFTDKKHKDVYDVQAGMTTKEVKKLRKEMKHMKKKGQVFLYDDQSNVMYLLDVQYDDGEEITEADIETSEVQAIIWKDKKHHKKDK